MTKDQKLYRHIARKWGKKTLIYINASINPVFTNDEVMYEEMARDTARVAARYANASLLEGDLQR